MKRDIDYICEPSSVAVVGASATPGKWGHAVLRGIIEGGYQGKVYPINPRVNEILGLRAYATVLDVDEPIELAVIGVGADIVPKVLEDCKRKGMKAALIISAGFAELGEEGRKKQEEIVKIAGGMRLVGPNILGIVNLSHNFTATYLRPLKGSFALICQGGNVTAEVENIAHSRELGFTQILNIGNQVDVGICDFLEYAQGDPNTKAILMYIEGFRKNEGRRFLRLAKQITKTKPIIAIKVGTTDVGARAASSHTGSLAGDDAIYDAAFKQVGVIRVRNSFELVDVADALLNLPFMKGNKFGILVDGGSHSVMACDAAAKYGLELASLSDNTQGMLRKTLFAHSSVGNPVDFAGAMDADVNVLTNAAAVMLQDANVDGLLVVGLNYGGYSKWWGSSEEVAPEFAGLVRKYGKPMVAHNTFVSEIPPAVQTIRAGGVPVFADVERAVRCMAALADYSRYRGECKGGS